MQRNIQELRTIILLALLCIANGAIVWSTVPTAQEEGLLALCIGVIIGLSAQELSLNKQRTLLYCGLISALSIAAGMYHVATITEFRTRFAAGMFPIPIEIVGGSVLLLLCCGMVFFSVKIALGYKKA